MEVAVYEKSAFWSWSAFTIWLIAIATVAVGVCLPLRKIKFSSTCEVGKMQEVRMSCMKKIQHIAPEYSSRN